MGERVSDMYARKMYGVMPIGMDGQPVKKTKRDFPYSYDAFLVYGRVDAEATGGVYSDRLMQWDFKKHDECLMKVFGDTGQFWNNRSYDGIEKFLQLYLDDDTIKLVKMFEGCNVSNGYPYWYFGYTSGKASEDTEEKKYI